MKFLWDQSEVRSDQFLRFAADFVCVRVVHHAPMYVYVYLHFENEML